MPSPVIASPGIYVVETDLSQYINTLTNTIPAFVVTASRGVTDEAVPYNNSLTITIYLWYSQ